MSRVWRTIDVPQMKFLSASALTVMAVTVKASALEVTRAAVAAWVARARALVAARELPRHQASCQWAPSLAASDAAPRRAQLAGSHSRRGCSDAASRSAISLRRVLPSAATCLQQARTWRMRLSRC